MEDNERGGGGKAPKERKKASAVAQTSSSKAGLFSLLRSPLAAMQKVTNMVSPRPVGRSSRHTAATNDGPSIVETTTTQEDVLVTANVQDAPAPFVAAQSPPVVPAPSVAVVPAVPTHLSSVVKEQEAAGWSPSKLNSLSFFLGNSQPTARPAAAAQLAGPDANQRPYLGLKYLLRAGPPGSTVPATWSSHYTHKPAGIQAPQGSMAAAAARPSSGRYAPYSLQPPSKANTGVAPASPYPAQASSFTPRPALGGAASFTPAPFRAPTPLALTPAPAPARTPADAPITKPGLPTSSMRLALANARMSTAAPEAAAAAPAPAIKLTPHPKSVRATARNVTFGTLGVPYGAGPSGVKRGRDHEAHAATPLLGSGIKNLSEYKRQRQKYTQQPMKSILAVGAVGPGRTPHHEREGGAVDTIDNGAPGASDSAHDTPEQQAQRVVQGAPGMPSTDTARRILEALDSMAKAGDHAGSTPYTGAKPRPLGAPGATPFSRGVAPPLDRLTPDQTPTAGVTRAGFAFTPATGAPPTPTILFPPAADAGASTHAKPASTPEPAAKRVTFSDVTPTAAPAAPTPSAAQAVTPPATLAAPKAHEQHTKSHDKHAKSVRFAVPADEGMPQEAVAATPAPSKTPGLESAPMFSFSASTSEVAKVVKSIVCSAGPAPASVSVPKFTFGQGRSKKPAAPAPVADLVPPPSAAKELRHQVEQAASVPLPDDDDEAEEPAAAKPAAAAASGWDAAFLQKSQAALTAASDAAAQEIEKAKTPAPAPVSSGWGDDLLKKNQAAMTAASEAIAAEIEKAKTPGAAASTPAPATGGWGASFLAANQSALSAASDAVAKEIEKAKTPEPAAVSTPTFTFGAASKISFGAAPNQEEAPATTPSAAGEAAATPAPVSSGWGDDLLKKNQAAMTAASEAIAAEIEKAKTPGAAAAPAPAAATGGWGAGFLEANKSALSAASDAVAKEIEKAKTPEPVPSVIPTFTFGAASDAAAATPAAAVPAFSFGAAASQSAASPFGAAGATAGSPAPAFTFGAASTPVAAPDAATASLAFAASAPAASAANPFGAPAASSTPSTAGFTFGAASSAAAATFGSAPSPFPSFGGAGAAAGAAGAPSAPAFTFGASTPAAPAAPAAASTPTFTFGATPAQPSQPESAAPAFGAAPAGGMFGAAAPQTSASNVFGAAPSTSPFGGFGAGSAPAAASAPAPAFGGFGAATTAQPSAFTFGGGSAPQQPAAPTFGSPFGGAPPAQSPFGSSTPAPAFGGGAAAPAFGAAPAASGSMFGAGGGTPMFGGQAPGAADAGASPFMFGQATPGATSFAFGGGSTPSPAPTFGGLATPPTLGNAGNTPFPFGAQPSPAPQPFGGVPAQPAFGAAPPAADGGGFTMGTMGDAGKSDRRKIRARRHG